MPLTSLLFAFQLALAPDETVRVWEMSNDYTKTERGKEEEDKGPETAASAERSEQAVRYPENDKKGHDEAG